MSTPKNETNVDIDESDTATAKEEPAAAMEESKTDDNATKTESTEELGE